MYGTLRFRTSARTRHTHPLLCPDNLSSLEALLSALENLDNLFESIDDAFNISLQHDDYERWEEKS
jgi:hypothetical protein